MLRYTPNTSARLILGIIISTLIVVFATFLCWLSLYFILLFLPLIFVKIKRSISIQIYSHLKTLFQIIIFAIVVIMLMLFSLQNINSSISSLIAIGIGILLVFISAKQTIFELTNWTVRYRTNLLIPLTVSLIFVFCVGYQLFSIYISHVEQSLLGLFKDPLTSMIFLLLFSYYLGFAVYLYQSASKILANK